MSRWIDADALIELIPKTSQSKFENCWTCKLLSAESVKEIINSAPTIEIVRCKECRYKDMELCPMYKLVVAGVRKYDDFCSYGEREGE